MNRKYFYLIPLLFFSGKLFAQQPVIDSFLPRQAYAGDVVTFYGKNLYPVTAVYFGGYGSYSLTQVSDTKVTAVVGCCPFSDEIILRTDLGADTVMGFSFEEPPFLTVGPFTPKSGLKDSVIKIYGSYFKHVNIYSVKFGNIPAASFKVDSDGQITAVVGNGSSGLVSVNNENSFDSFYYEAPKPVIYSFSPNIGNAGTTVTIYGDNFKNLESVEFGGVTADSFKIISSYKIMAWVPANAVSGSISVTSFGVTTFKSGFDFISTVFLCPPPGTAILNAGSGAAVYQWQVDTGSYYGYTNIANNSYYTGSNSPELQLKNIPSRWYNYKYRCIADDNYYSYPKYFVLKFANTWKNAGNNNWENASNWSCEQLPDVDTDVIINSGNVLISSNITCRSLSVKNGANVTVAPGYTITVTH